MSMTDEQTDKHRTTVGVVHATAGSVARQNLLNQISKTVYN